MMNQILKGLDRIYRMNRMGHEVSILFILSILSKSFWGITVNVE